MLTLNYRRRAVIRRGRDPRGRANPITGLASSHAVAREVVYTHSSDQLDLTKTFTVFPDKYLVRMVVKFGVRVAEGTEARQQLVVSVYNDQDPAKLKSVLAAWLLARMRSRRGLRAGQARGVRQLA